MNNIKENNALIAEFMGAEKAHAGTIENQYNHDKYLLPENPYWLSPLSMKYNTSWDWIMPVIEKIGSLGYWYQLGTATDINSASFRKLNHSIGVTCRNTPLDATYTAVIHFINWYNNQNQIV